MKSTKITDSYNSMEGIGNVPASCPISGELLDERAVRIVASISVTLLTLYLILVWQWIPFVLFVDFSMRGVVSRKWAPFAVLARNVVKHLNFGTKKMINAAPKIFAARLGLTFSAILVILQLTGLQSTPASYIVGGMFFIAAFLEAAFSFCLGCQIYQFIQRVKHHSFGDDEGI